MTTRPMLLLASLSVVLAAAPARAAENRRDVSIDSTAEIGRPVRATSRTIMDVVALAIAEGTDMNVNPGVAGSLGLRPDYRMRVLRYRARNTPDNLEREFQVVYKRARGGGVEPVTVLMDVAEVSLTNAMKSVRGTTLQVDLDGALQRAAGREGVQRQVAYGAIEQKDVSDLYKSEIDFYERGSLGLPYER